MLTWLRWPRTRERKFSSSPACTRLDSVSALRLPHLVYTAQALLIELNQLTGIAAILTFPLDVDLVEAEEKEAKEEAERAAAEQNG